MRLPVGLPSSLGYRDRAASLAYQRGQFRESGRLVLQDKFTNPKHTIDFRSDAKRAGVSAAVHEPLLADAGRVDKGISSVRDIGADQTFARFERAANNQVT